MKSIKVRDKRAVLYVRVSTDEQAKYGYSLKDQRERLIKYCDDNGISIDKIFSEDHSAKSFKRPAFSKLINYVKEKKGTIDSLVFLKWDRFSRNLLESLKMLDQLKKLKVKPICIENPIDLENVDQKILLAINLITPEVENDRRASNTKMGMRRAKKEGRWVATAPKGYSYDRSGLKPTIVPNDDAKYVRKAFEEVSKDVLNVNEVRKQLSKNGFKYGKSAFYEMLKRPVYMGKIYIEAWKDEPEQIVDGIHQPIVSEGLYNKVQEVLEGKKRTIKRLPTNQNLILRGNLICPACGRKLTGSASTNRFKTKYYYYHCQNSCKSRFKAEEVNVKLQQLLESIRLPSEVIELFKILVMEVFYENNQEKSKEISSIKENIRQLESKIVKTEDLFIDEQLSKEAFNSIVKRTKKEIESYRDRLNEYQLIDNDINNYLDGTNLLKDLPEHFKRADIRSKKKLLGSIFPNNLIFEGNNYRTPELNSVITLINNKDREFRRIKNKLPSKNARQSVKVASPGLEPGSKV